MKKEQVDINITNDNDKEILLIIEPWAEEYNLKPNSSMIMSIYGGSGNRIDTSIGKEYFVVWAWSGSYVNVFIDGVDCTRDSLLIPSPF